MDIIVTIPKYEYANDDLENVNIQNGDLAFWTLSKVPKQLEINDRVYFIKHNKIHSSMKVIEIKRNSRMTCTTTNREWRGKCQLLLDDFKYENDNSSIRGFQGFRYKR